MMTRVVMLLLAGLVAPAMSAQQPVLRGHAAAPDASIRLVAPVERVQVIGWTRDSVDVSGTVPTGSRVEFAAGDGMARGLKMYVELPGERLGHEGALLLRVPRGARVWLKTGSADIDVAGVTGGLDLNVVGGAIVVHGNPRELRAESMDGDITVDGAPAWVRAKTATGNIALSGGGDDVGASTISGTIRSRGGPVERMKLESTTGPIYVANLPARAGTLEIDTHGGGVDLELPREAGVALDLATITGSIENEWSRARPTGGGEGRGMTLAAVSGMNGMRIVVRSFKGTIHLRAR